MALIVIYNFKVMLLCSKSGNFGKGNVISNNYIYRLFNKLLHAGTVDFSFIYIHVLPLFSYSKCFPLFNIVFDPALRGSLLTARPDGFEEFYFKLKRKL